MPEKNNFKPSIKVNKNDIILIVVILAFVILIPFLLRYFTDPNRTPINEIIKNPIMFVLNIEETDIPDSVAIPIINKKADLSVLQTNPTLITYTGFGLVIIAAIIGIALIKNSLKD